MNYPVWDVAFGAGLLIALVAILHVFVSHFAVGGGLFLVVTERKARRNNDTALLGWLKAHTKFFVLVTVVFGAISGVGIWFTIGLISPTATSDLIHIYVWGWAIEWVFFFLEITAALLYLYGWDKLEPRLHQWYGWIYFIAAYLSLVDHQRHHHLHAHLRKLDQESSSSGEAFSIPPTSLRWHSAPPLRWRWQESTPSSPPACKRTPRSRRASCAGAPGGSCLRWPFSLLAWWYIRRIPKDAWANARGPMPTATHFALYAVILLSVTFAAGAARAGQPGRMHLAFSLLVALVALGAMGSFEFVREGIRKPYVISNYLYANSLYSTQIPGDAGFSVGRSRRRRGSANRQMDRSARSHAGQPGRGGRRDLPRGVPELPHSERLPRTASITSRCANGIKTRFKPCWAALNSCTTA